MNRSYVNDDKNKNYDWYNLYKSKKLHKLNNKDKSELLSLSLPNFINSFQSVSSNNNNSNSSNQCNLLEIENFNINLNLLSNEELKAQIELLKKTYESKLNEIEETITDISFKDTRINHITDQIKQIFKQDEISNISKEINTNSIEISNLKTQIAETKKDYMNMTKSKHKESEYTLKNKIDQIRKEYQLKIDELNLNKQADVLKLEIEKIQKENEELENAKMEQSMFNGNRELELIQLQEEIDKHEKIIRENQMLRSKSLNISLDKFDDKPMILQNDLILNGNNEFVCMFSQLNTPMYSMNSNVNFSINKQDKSYNNGYNQYYQDTSVMDECNESIFEEIKPNKINNLNLGSK